MTSLENPMLEGILVGLKWSDGLWVLDRSFLSCCNGDGVAVDREGSVRRCTLSSRLSELERLQLDYLASWGENQPMMPGLDSFDQCAKILEEVSGVVRGIGYQAYEVQGQARRPSLLWAMAMAAIWRFGKTAKVLKFREQPHLVADSSRWRHADMIFLEGVTGLWDKANLACFEAIIKAAYMYQCPIWIEWLTHSQRQDKGGSLKAQFSRKVKHLRSRPGRDYLSESTGSKLDDMVRTPAAFQLMD